MVAAPAAAADAARKQLAEGMQQIAQMGAHDPESGMTAFHAFRKGVIHASSGRGATPEELLSNLEPKEAVLRFLVELHGRKKIYQKQIAAVLAVLLQVSAWLAALQSLAAMLPDGLPGDLATLLEEHAAEASQNRAPEPPEPSGAAGAGAGASDVSPPRGAPQAASPPLRSGATGAGAGAGDVSPPRGAPQAASPPLRFERGEYAVASVSPKAKRAAVRPTLSEVHAALGSAAAKATPPLQLPIKACAQAVGRTAAGDSEVNASLELLEKARKLMEAADFSAADMDSAVTAFETFRRAVVRVVRSDSTRDDDVLDGIGEKGQILEFLVDFYERRQKYRSRVAATLMQLLNFAGWRAAAEADASVRAAVHDLVVEPDQLASVNYGSLSVSMVCMSESLQAAALAAKARGSAGALSVRVTACYNLVGTDAKGMCDTYVRVSLARRTKRTDVITDNLNPRWDAAEPFVFEVPSLDASVTFEVLDSNFFKEDSLGKLTLPLSEVPTRPGSQTLRRALQDVPHGELEVDVLYAAAGEASPEAWGPPGRMDPWAREAPAPPGAAAAKAAGPAKNPWAPAAPPAASAPSSAPGLAKSNPFAPNNPFVPPAGTASARPAGRPPPANPFAASTGAAAGGARRPGRANVGAAREGYPGAAAAPQPRGNPWATTGANGFLPPTARRVALTGPGVNNPFAAT